MSSSATDGQRQFPHWLPPAARQRITDLQSTFLGQGKLGRDLLARLATHSNMKTDVWEKLPPEPKGVEGNIIDWALIAFTIFPALRRPYPKTRDKWRTWGQRLEKHPPLIEPAYLSQLSLQLWEEISKLKDETDRYWPSLWEGDSSVNSDQVLSILDQLRAFYVRMHAEYSALVATLPKVARWNRRGWQKFFTEYLSKQMTATYGQPLDPIVGALAGVAFDISEGVSAETVRGRRRGIAAPENSKRKTR
jgi:hypothetical protein